MPNFVRKNSGVDAEMNVGIVEYSIVAGASENGTIHEGSVCKVAKIDRGG